jgi:hypothetical protein
VRQCDPISPGNDAVPADWLSLGHVARRLDPSWPQQPCDGNLAQSRPLARRDSNPRKRSVPSRFSLRSCHLDSTTSCDRVFCLLSSFAGVVTA